MLSTTTDVIYQSVANHMTHAQLIRMTCGTLVSNIMTRR